MPYIIKKKSQLLIVNEASAYIFKGSKKECEAFLTLSPPTEEEARKRQLQFLQNSNRGQGWRKGFKGSR